MIKTVKCGIAAAVVVAAGIAAFQSYGSYGTQDNSLLMQNVEALAQGPDGGDGDASGDSNGAGFGQGSTPTTYEECLQKGGVWGYSSVYHGTKNLQVEGAGGFKIIWDGKEYGVSFSTKKGKRYELPATEYKCIEDSHNSSSDKKNCCVYQGLYYCGVRIG